MSFYLKNILNLRNLKNLNWKNSGNNYYNSFPFLWVFPRTLCGGKVVLFRWSAATVIVNYIPPGVSWLSLSVRFSPGFPPPVCLLYFRSKLFATACVVHKNSRSGGKAMKTSFQKSGIITRTELRPTVSRRTPLETAVN